jgi:hypothetical protein
MDIDNKEEQQQIMHQSKFIDVASMKDNFHGLAKTIEILQSVYNNVEGDKIKNKITKNFEEIVKMGNHLKFLLTTQQHNEDMMKSPDLVKSILGLINAIVTHIFIHYNDQDPKKLKDKQLTTYHLPHNHICILYLSHQTRIE